MPTAHLTDRALLAVSGEDAAAFLGGLVTCAVEAGGPPRYGAILTPQGKIIVDFLLLPRDGEAGGFLLDVPRAQAQALLKRLAMYRLRAKVTLADVSGELGVAASWDGVPATATPVERLADPRWPALGWRLVGPPAALDALADAAPADYDNHRIGLAVPQGGRDFAYGDAFPHEACMDQLGGVDFGKGCYVGQEVVSRTQHRGTARTRVAALRFARAAPTEGAEIRAGDKAIGRVGSVDALGRRAIALLRLDRLADALAANLPLLAGETPVEVVKPEWAAYAFPDKATSDAASPAKGMEQPR